MPLPLDPSINPGQSGHNQDHETIATVLNGIASAGDGDIVSWDDTSGALTPVTRADLAAGLADEAALTGAFRAGFMPEAYGAEGDGVANDTAALVAAEAAAAAAGGEVVLTAGKTYAIASVVEIGDKAALIGPGGAPGQPAATILCTAAGSQVLFTGRGGVSGGFLIDGNGVATTPLKRTVAGVGGGAGRTFLGISVQDAAEDNILISGAQNDAWIGCESTGATRDNLVLDDGAGGLLFERFESNEAGRHALMVTESSGTGPYVEPTHIKFVHSLFERGLADAPAVRAEEGIRVTFDNCVIQRDVGTSTLVDIDGDTIYTFDGCSFSGDPDLVACITAAAWAKVHLMGACQWNGPLLAISGASGFITDQAYHEIGGGTVGTGLGGASTFELSGMTPERSHTNWNNCILNTLGYQNTARISTGVQNDEVVMLLPRPLAAGAWTLALMHIVGTNRGIYTVDTSVDGSNWTTHGTIDGYAASAAFTRSTLSVAALAASTRYIRLRMLTKNGSSSAYFGYLCGFSGARPAA